MVCALGGSMSRSWRRHACSNAAARRQFSSSRIIIERSFAIAVEARQGGPGRVRIPNATKDVLTDFVLDHVQRYSEVRIDGWVGYNGVGEHRFSHLVTNVKASGAPPHVSMPEVHRGR